MMNFPSYQERETNTLHIFISFSQLASKTIAFVVKELLTELYQTQVSRGLISFFYSEESMSEKGEVITAQDRINIALHQSLICISILTEENFEKPWLMYEAGAIMTKPDGKVIPLAFGRSKDEIEDIFRTLQRFDYNASIDDEQNKSNFIKFLKEMNSYIRHLEQKNHTIQHSLDEAYIELFIENKWRNKTDKEGRITYIGYNSKLEDAFDKHLNKNISKGIVLNKWFSDEWNNKESEHITPKTIYKYFQNIKEKFKTEHNKKLIAEKFFKEDKHIKDNDDKNVETIFLNQDKGLRISTFVGFTDGISKILLFKRKDNNIIVKNNNNNNNWDVFGSLPFENKSISEKVPYNIFLDMEIERIEVVNGSALESNERGYLGMQSVVMHGILAIVRAEKLVEVAKWGHEQLYVLDIYNEQDKHNIDAAYQRDIDRIDSKRNENNVINQKDTFLWQDYYTSKAWLCIKALESMRDKSQVKQSATEHQRFPIRTLAKQGYQMRRLAQNPNRKRKNAYRSKS